MSISFEDVPYEGRPIDTTRPELIAVEAWLRGVPAAHPARARVLELGCAEGANLIPHAYHCPEARFVGVDSSPRMVATAQERASRLGLDNITFVCADILKLPAEADGPWDFIVCHGVFSWVPEPVRDAIFDALGERLAPGGVGYVSYNVEPGWATRGLVRQVLMARTRRIDDPREKLQEARELLTFLADTPFADHHYAASMAVDAKNLLTHRDPYIAHEYLTGVNEAFRYGDIAKMAEARGLRFLAELSPIAHRGVEERMRSAVGHITDDPIEAEELTDVLYGRAFRASLFSRADATLRDVDEARASLLSECGFVTRLSPRSSRVSLTDGDSEDFVDADDVRVAVTHPLLKASLLELSRAFPVALTLSELTQRAGAVLQQRRVEGYAEGVSDAERDTLGEDLMRLLSLRHLELRVLWPEMVAAAGSRPRVSTLARSESRWFASVTNVFHSPVYMDDAARYLVELMDGSRSRDELTTQLLATLQKHAIQIRDEAGNALLGDKAIEFMRLFVDRHILLLESQGVMER
ncbi:MAG: methyltransferase domain-containing protein [Sandaracinaceae bacterium]